MIPPGYYESLMPVYACKILTFDLMTALIYSMKHIDETAIKRHPQSSTITKNPFTSK